MTSETTLPGLVPAADLDLAPVPVPEDGAPDGPDTLTPGAEEPLPGRRRRALLILLLGLLGVFLLFAGWYLISRKPITENPLPGVIIENLPHYSFSVYGVTAPTGVAVTADGSRIYATQTEGDPQVIAFDGSGKQVASLKPPATTGSEHVPVYVVVNPTNGDVYVSDRPAAAIYIYSAEGLYLRAFNPGPALNGWQPLGMAFDAKGYLFVTSVGAPFQAVHEFGPDGAFVRTFGSPGEFSFPNGVSVDANEYVYVADSSNGRLVVFDGGGVQRAAINRGSREGDLGLPRGTAVDDSNRVYVVDLTANAVQIYHAFRTEDRQPKYIGRFGVQGSGDGEFGYPNSVAVDGRGRVYVTDRVNNRVQVWSY
jgi:tripartite motif-containing protein 71